MALEAQTKFAIAVVPAKRTLASVRQLIGELARRTQHQCDLFITSDEYKPYRRVLLEVYGLSKPRRRKPGAGRPPHPGRVAPAGMVYATIHQHRRKGRVVRVTTHRLFGSVAELDKALANSPGE